MRVLEDTSVLPFCESFPAWVYVLVSSEATNEMIIFRASVTFKGAGRAEIIY